MEELKIIRIDHANPPINKGKVYLNDGRIINFNDGEFFEKEWNVINSLETSSDNEEGDTFNDWYKL